MNIRLSSLSVLTLGCLRPRSRVTTSALAAAGSTAQVRTTGTATTTTSTKAPLVAYPRAAVAATIQWAAPGKTKPQNHYLLVKRKNPPDRGKWSCPGGKIETGEATLDAAKREVEEETGLGCCLSWHKDSFLTTDAIVPAENGNDDYNERVVPENNNYAFHYVIAHCFARVQDGENSAEAPVALPSDDALDAKWWTLAELRDLDCSDQTIVVVERVEALNECGLLPV
mmetsp:Transcript_24097/g.51193  ORF Transcript_24097/g.51193 Transcript_24097/m.51193 type:complete len:227 (-) Transcript_24097:98-778(-)